MRIRTIKPEFWRSESLAGLPDFTLLVAIGLLNYADDDGYFNANTALIKADLFPLRDECSSIPVAITELSNRHYIELFEGADSRIYGRVVNFEKHQVINKHKPSKIKEFCIHKTGELRLSGTSTVLVPSGTGNREQGRDIAPTAARVGAVDHLFIALAIAEGSNPAQLTPSAGRSIAIALLEIRKASPDVTTEEIGARARAYRKLYPNAACTAHALKMHWPKLAAGGANRAPAPLPEPEAWKLHLKDSYRGEDWADSAANCMWNELPRNWQEKIVREMKKERTG